MHDYMINLIQSPSTVPHMSTENYSLMVMLNDHMVDGYGVDEDGGEDGF
jgi:hypothetical protein